jgi:glycosyltransferase involved in cell wall biosynthesis
MYAALALWMAVNQLKSKRLKWWYATAALLLTTGLLLASSKIILLATALGLLVITPRNLNLKSALRATLLAVFVGGVMLAAVKPIRERVWTMVVALQSKNVDQNNPDSMRKGIWSCSLFVIQQNPWLGVGLGDFQVVLNDCYAQEGYALALERQFNTHNQYLQIWLSAGLLPMLALLATMLSQIIIGWVTRQRMHLAFGVMMALVFLTENVLERQDGVFFFVFFTALLVHRSWLSGTQNHVINGKWKHQPLTGVQRYAAEVSHHLAQGPYTIVAPPQVSNYFKGLLPRPAMLLVWEQFILPWQLRFMGSPALVNLGNTSPVYYTRKLVVIHDVAPLAHPEWFSERFVRWYRFLMQNAAQHSFKVATISHFSAREISLHMARPIDAIGLAPNGIPSLGPDSVPPQVPQPFILCVGTLSNRKNQHRLIEAFLQWNPNHVHLVLAGSTSSDITWDYQPLLDQAIATGHVHWVNHPTDAQLKGLYTHATAFACVSLYEGFGLPIAEALSHHLPCLVADIPVFREYFEGHALFVDPEHTSSIVAGLKQIIHETPLWTERATAFDPLSKHLDFKHSAQRIAAWTNSATALTSQATTA